MSIVGFLEKTFLGNPKEKELKRIQKKVEEVNGKEAEFHTLGDVEWSQKVSEQKGRCYTDSDEVLVEMLAVVKHACRRLQGEEYEVNGKSEIWNMIPYDVQIVGAIALLEGKIAEMKTGEGKTLVAGIASSVVAFAKKGVHVITVNDYLAQRDVQLNTPLFEILGLTTGVVIQGKSNSDRKTAYEADITYGTNNEFGFDYLRDNMAQESEKMVQRDLHFALVDEVDSILIDESRTPLIISAPAGDDVGKYAQYSALVQQLSETTHYTIDEKQKTAILTEEGVQKMESLLGVKNIYTEKGFQAVHHIEQALRAGACFLKDKDYIVSPEHGVVIVDEFTGRLMPGRRFSDGLHQALEAKEGVQIKQQSKTMASITFQNYFRLYDTLAGMTGTAETEEEEFRNIYALSVVSIPPNKPIQRNDLKDVVYKSEQGKFEAIAQLIKEKSEVGQPVLIGTASIEKSEMLSAVLKRHNIKHEVLNAKQHAREAEIIAIAGQKESITIATNMAGRGTDIKLGEGVKELGGLCIVGSERHESRRIDNQLRGRSGRQGDPGETRFFISLEDSLMRMFGSEKMLKMLNALQVPDDLPIENSFISSGIENAQKRVEGLYFDRRKHVLQYDNVMNRQREIIYSRRKKIVLEEDLHGEFLNRIRDEASNLVDVYTANRESHRWDIQEIFEDISSFHKDESYFSLEKLKACESTDEIKALATEFLTDTYTKKREQFLDHESCEKALRMISLRVIDTLFVEHLESMRQLKEQVSLRGYGQRDPLMEYKKEAFHLFTKLLNEIRKGQLSTFFHIEVKSSLSERKPVSLTTNSQEISNQSDSKSFTQVLSPRPSPTQQSKPSSSSRPAPVSRPNKTTLQSSPKKGVTVIRVEDENVGNRINGEKVGRNDPCSCGSGKKFKKCCGASQ